MPMALRDLSVARTGARPAEAGFSSAEARGLTGVTDRQLSHWSARGIIPRLGSGNYRRFTTGDLEVLHALAQLAALGCDTDRLRAAADTVRSHPVDGQGERLVVMLDGRTSRHHIDGRVTTSGPAWVVPLRSFAGVGSDA